MFFATASRGTEQVLAAELGALGIAGAEPQRGGVAFGARLEDGYRACLWSRIASRVLLPLHTFSVESADDLYAGVRTIDWTEHIAPDGTLAVDAAGGRSPAGPRHFVALKTKDAIVDRIRAAAGRRPDVDTERPDVRINVHLAGAQVTVALDLSGESLHRRGIGRTGTTATLKENLAAAILWIAGWPGLAPGTPLYDPLCGSGTLLLEAAWIALDVAPGLTRGHSGAEGWCGHDRSTWRRLLVEARERRDAGARHELALAGSDGAAIAVQAARRNAERAGIARHVRVFRRELRDVEAPRGGPGLIVTNPPYGERLGRAGELGPLYELLGDVIKRRFAGWTAWVFTGTPALGKRIGLRASSRHVLYNGPIEARLLEFPIAATPVTGDAGPGWRRPRDEASGFANRLRKNLTERRRWAERERLTCYRLYDADVPEYNVAVDWYAGAVRVEEYARPRKVDAAVAEQRLRDVMLVVPEVLGVDPADVVLRVRERRGPGEQHEQRDAQRRLREVHEGDLRFLVNLTDYLDTGLFLDDRLLRRWVRERAAGVDCLNLFAYTCAMSVAAAAGGARSTTSLDLSQRYLDWGRKNFAANGIKTGEHRFLRNDVTAWLERGGDRRRYGLIFLAPPTWSRSKAMRGEFDVERDHAPLLRHAARLLAPGGELLFSVNRRQFELDHAALRGLEPVEITAEVTPPDFAARPRLRAWRVAQRGASTTG